MHLRFAALAALVACSDGEPTKTPADGPTACDNPTIRSTPEDGATSVYYRSRIEFELTDPDPTAEVTVAEVGGAEVPGSTTVEGAVVTWTGVLQWMTAHEATLTHACGSDVLRFTTSGEHPEEVDLTGRTWTLDVADGDWIDPAGVGVLLASSVDAGLALSVTGPPDEGTIPLLVGVATSGSQDLCVPTVDLADSPWSDPVFTAEIPRFELPVDDASLVLEEVVLSGAFSPGADRITDATLSGIADTRDLGPAFELDDTPEAFCELVASFGDACVVCRDGAETCIPVEVREISAPEIRGLHLAVVTPDDVLADPTCGG